MKNGVLQNKFDLLCQPRGLAQLIKSSTQGMLLTGGPQVTGSNPVNPLEITSYYLAIEPSSIQIFQGRGEDPTKVSQEKKIDLLCLKLEILLDLFSPEISYQNFLQIIFVYGVKHFNIKPHNMTLDLKYRWDVIFVYGVKKFQHQITWYELGF